MKIKWRGDNNVRDGFADGIAKYQIDYNPFHKEWVLYGPGLIDPNGESFETVNLAEAYADFLECGK